MPRHRPKVRPDVALDAAAAFPDGHDLEPLGLHEADEVVADLVGDGLVEDALVAEALVVHLEAFEFDAGAAGLGGFGLVAEQDIAEVGVTGFGADGGELLRDVLDHEGGVGGGGEGFEEFGVGHGTQA